jgi:signal transduction histidine kinase
LSETLRTTLFQAIRELLTNVVKHAGAHSARVTLGGGEGRVVVSVEDDGRGIEQTELDRGISPHDGFGLFNIRERLTYVGGCLSAVSAPGQGTTIRLEVPLYG